MMLSLTKLVHLPTKFVFKKQQLLHDVQSFIYWTI